MSLALLRAAIGAGTERGCRRGRCPSARSACTEVGPHGTNSSAPMSQPTPLGRGSPSKYVVGAPVHVPASMAGEPGLRCMWSGPMKRGVGVDVAAEVGHWVALIMDIRMVEPHAHTRQEIPRVNPAVPP